VESNHEQVCLLPAQEIDNRVDSIVFNYMAQDIDPVAAYYHPEFISQELIAPDVVLPEAQSALSFSRTGYLR
jgi:hypothetical protein